MIATPKRLLIAKILSATGLAIALFQTRHFYAVREGLAGFKSFCSFNALGQNFDCAAVDMSRFAELFAGLPLSGFAAGWYLALFIVAWIARNPFWRREALRALFLMTAFATVMSTFYLAIMMMVLKTGCILCLSLDAINFILFGIVLSLKPEGTRVHKPELKKWKVFAGFTLASTVACILLGISFKQLSLPADQVDALIQETLQKPPLPVDTTSDAQLSVGNAGAPVTLVKFSDFQCPHCRHAAMAVHSLMARYPHQLRFIYKNFPLDSGCNRMVNQPMHPAACEASKVVICAEKLGGFLPVYETIFDRQEKLVPGLPTQIAKDLGVDAQKLEACLQDPATDKRLQRDIEEGIRLGIESTPTFYINGKQVNGALPTPVWVQMIDQILKEAGPAK